jgi:pimeloyl-ACP methyl ester carboxylesterase
VTEGRSRVRDVWRRIHYVWVRVGLAALVVLPIAAFLMFRAQGLPPDTWSASESLSIDDNNEYIRFDAPQAGNADRVIVLPGCPVEAEAYAPLARGLAIRGLTAIVVKIPYRCAPFPTHVAALHARVLQVLATCSSCLWTIAGHSRGARHALEAVAAMPNRFARLVLMGSTHPRERDFSRLSIPVLKIEASNDGVAPREASAANRRLLPAATRWNVIEGGNHAQFAYYGWQLFDGAATIAREQQHDEAVAAVLSFINETALGQQLR